MSGAGRSQWRRVAGRRPGYGKRPGPRSRSGSVSASPKGSAGTTGIGEQSCNCASATVTAEAWDGAVWAGPYGAQVSIYAFDGCIDIGTSVSDGPDPYFDVGFRQVDASWWYWTYLSYTVNLV